MIQTYSSTIRRKEMEAVLTCMVDEKIGPGETNLRLIQTVKEMMHCDGAVALRSPALALEYALKALDLPKEASVVISALAPSWQLITLEKLGYKAEICDVTEQTGLMPVELVEDEIKKGARLIILTESMGVLPEIKPFLALGVPIIEDISQSALSYYPSEEPSVESGEASDKVSPESPAAGNLGKRAGMYGSYTILGMEDRDIITAGGGAVLIAPGRREWTVLKHIVDELPSIDVMPDMNAALAFVELKEYERNEAVRREFHTLFSRAIMAGRHKTFVRGNDRNTTIYSFPLVLNSGFRDVKSYAHKKGIEVRPAYENSVIAFRQEELKSKCICANSLLLRCAMFPLYPRLGQKDAAIIVKVLTTLP